MGLPFTLRGLHFDSDEDHVPTKIFQDLASLPLKGELRSLTMKRVPQVFVPLILANQGNISGTKTTQIHIVEKREILSHTILTKIS